MSVSYIGDENLAIHHEISIDQNGSVQNAVRYLFVKFSSIGSSTAQSSGIIQSSITSVFFLSKHQVSRRIPNVIKGIVISQIFFILIKLSKTYSMYHNFGLKYNIKLNLIINLYCL